MGARTIHGEVDEGYKKAADEFRRNFTDRRELGAGCAVVREGARFGSAS